MKLHKTCLPYMVIVAVVMSIYSIFLVHLTQSFRPGSSTEYSDGQDPWNYHPRPAEPPPCQCTPESLAGLGARREVVVGLSFPYKNFNSNHWFHISEYYVSRHTHVAPKLPPNATVYIVAPHEQFVANLIPMTFFLLLLAFTDGTARTAEVLPRRALAQLAVTGDVLALDNVGVESYVYDRSLPAFHRTRKYEPGERQTTQQHPRSLAAVLESGGGAGGKGEGARIPTTDEVAPAAAAAAAAAKPAAGVSKKKTIAGADARADAGAAPGAMSSGDTRSRIGGSGIEARRRRQLQGTAVARASPAAVDTSGAAASARYLRAPESSGGEDAWRTSLSTRRQAWGGGRVGAGEGGDGEGEETRGDKEWGDADAALLAFDSNGVGDVDGGGSGTSRGGGGSVMPPEALGPVVADAPALPVAALSEQPGGASSHPGDAARSGGGTGIDGRDLEHHLDPREESNAGDPASASAAAGKSTAQALDAAARVLTARADGTDPAVEAAPEPAPPPSATAAVGAKSAIAGAGTVEESHGAEDKERGQKQQVDEKEGEVEEEGKGEGRERGEGKEVEAQLFRRDDDQHQAGGYLEAPAEFFPLATLAGQQRSQQQRQPATRPCACARYIGEFGSAPVERGYWFREEKVENTRARIDALCGDVYRRRRDGEATEAGGGEGGYTSRKRLVIYQRNKDRRLLELDENVKVFQNLLGPEWDVVPIVHANEHEPCWLYSQLMDADMLLTPHGFQSMLLLFLPPGATILEVFPYKYWKEGYAPLAKEWGVRHEHIMSRPMSWEKRLALFFVPLERCMKSIHCRKWSRGADVRLEEHHLRQIAKAAEQASRQKEDFLPPSAPVAPKRVRRE